MKFCVLHLGGNKWSQKPNNERAKQTRAGEQRRHGDAGIRGWPSDQRAGLPGSFSFMDITLVGVSQFCLQETRTQGQRLLQERVSARMTSHRTHEECQFYHVWNQRYHHL